MLYDNLSINQSDNLTFCGLDTIELANQYGTPAYFVDEDKIRYRCRMYIAAMKRDFDERAFPLFAGKALCFKEMYRILKSENMGIDVVSSGEIYTADSAGFPMENAYFHGNNKTRVDIEFAMEKGVGHFVCDNFFELEMIDEIAKQSNIEQKVLLRITPGIDAHTNEKINTGKVKSKFGVPIETGQAFELTKKAISLNNIKLEGFHCHIGSQIFDCNPLADAAVIMIRFIAKIKNELRYECNTLNLGGGMAVPYTKDDPKVDYESNIKFIADRLKDECEKLDVALPQVLMEPGRSIVADAGITLYEIGGIKEIPGFKNYVSVDGGMTDNPRFTLYKAPYTVYIANKIVKTPNYWCNLVGRCCESGDVIQEDIKIPHPDRGDIVAVLTTGAYNYTMSSHYNAIPKPPLIMIKDKKCREVIRRETFEDITNCQI